jgi:UPF0271 protein
LRIDLNSDSGESFGNWKMGDDAKMMTIVTSANGACGFHAGDPHVMRATVTAAAANNVTVGAHPAYRDLPNFGRVFMDLPPAELTDAVIYQIGALQAMSKACGTKVSYVKPHGALYNVIVHHEAHAAAVVKAVAEVDPDLPILCLPGTVIERVTREAGLNPVAEAFADRAYTPEGTLVSRQVPGAVLHDPVIIQQRVVQMATEGTVTAVDGSTVQLNAQSICVHGDTPGAVAIAQGVREALESAGVELVSFA